MKKRLIVLAFVVLCVLGALSAYQASRDSSWEAYEKCAANGGATAESDPPTCYPVGGGKPITPLR